MNHHYLDPPRLQKLLLVAHVAIKKAVLLLDDLYLALDQLELLRPATCHLSFGNGVPRSWSPLC